MARSSFEKVKGTLRVGVFAFCVTSLFGLFAARRVYGDVGESSMIVGRELTTMRDLVGGSSRVHVNGQSVFVASAMTDASVDAVMDRFETLCRQNSQGLDQAVAAPAEALSKEMAALVTDTSALRLGIMRKQGEGESVIACLAHPGAGGMAALAARLSAFAKSKDLGDLGKLRYAYARRTDGGRTHVVTVWTDGSLQVGKMFALDGGETPGSDPENVPRPAGATRLLTAEVDGAPYGVRIYQTAGSVDDALGHYQTELPKLGWQPQEAVARKAKDTRAYAREGVDLLVLAHRDGDRTFVSLVEMQAKAP